MRNVKINEIVRKKIVNGKIGGSEARRNSDRYRCEIIDAVIISTLAVDDAGFTVTRRSEELDRVRHGLLISEGKRIKKRPHVRPEAY